MVITALHRSAGGMNVELVDFGCYGGGRLRPAQIVEQGQFTGVDGMVCIKIHCRRPCLLRIAHGMPAFAVHPLIELPRIVDTLAIGVGQGNQHLLGILLPAVANKGGNVEAADHGPDAAIMVLVGQIQVAAAVVFAPVALSRIDRWIDGLGGIRFCHTHLAHIAQNVLGTMAVGHTGEDGEEVAQAVAPITIFAECHPWQVKRAAGDGAHVVVEHVPFQADGL